MMKIMIIIPKIITHDWQMERIYKRVFERNQKIKL